MSERVKLRMNCAGYGGSPISVFGMFDPVSGVLLIGRESPYETAAREGFLRITTIRTDPHHDGLFTEEDVRDAISAFFEMNSQGLVQFAEGMARLQPANKIEQDGMDERGVKYRVSPDIQNGQVAVLMAARAARAQVNVASAQDFLKMVSVF